MNTIVGRQLIYGNQSVHNTVYGRDEFRQKQNLQKKRLQETKRRMFFLTVSMVLIIALGIVLGGFMSNAEAGSGQPQEYKYFTRYTVSYNETLWDIAEQYKDSHYDRITDYIDEVKNMNHIENVDDIRAGSVLLIPYYSSEHLR